MVKQKERWWDWPSAVFLILALFCAASRLQTTNWTEYLGRIQILVLGAAALGLALGYSKFRPLYSFLYGLFFTLVIPAWSLSSLIRSDLWLERVQSLVGRLGLALGQLFSNQAVRDPILFLTSMILLFWVTTLWGAYALVRKGSPWYALVIPGILSLVVEYSFDMYGMPDPGTLFSLFFLLFTVLLIARVYYIRSRKDWVARGHLIENEVGFDLGRGAAITGVLLVAMAWYSPQVIKNFTPGTVEQRTLSQDIQHFRDRFEKAVSSLRSPAPLVVESLSDSLYLGNGNVLGNDTVLTITPLNGRLNAGRFYWTGRDYDTYLNDQWQATEENQVAVGPNTKPLDYAWIGRVAETVDIVSKVSYLRTLYFPGALISMSRPTLAVTGITLPGESDVSAILMDPPLRAGETYRVTGSVSVPTIYSMRASATQPYPAWVTKKYLQLPDNFSPKIQALARQISEGKTTPYDKVDAITTYLRENIKYESVLPQIPPGSDPLEWFLFVHKAGFCNYYASSEVLMLRSIGIPARMGVGYAQGTWSDTDKNYSIEAKDYHAWPEIFFPGLGWVPFEPTAGQPVLEFLQGEAETVVATLGPTQAATPILPLEQLGIERGRGGDLQGQITPFELFLFRYGRPLGGGVMLLLLGFGIFRLLDKPIRHKTPLIVFVEDSVRARGWRVPRWLQEWARLARRSPMEKLFARVGELLKAWGKPPALSLTPAEQVGALTELVPDVGEQARILLEEYQNATYSPHQVNYARAKQAAGDLRMNGYRAWVNRRNSRKAA
jgi:transglutaminase-like putative cysteine protease